MGIGATRRRNHQENILKEMRRRQPTTDSGDESDDHHPIRGPQPCAKEREEHRCKDVIYDSVGVGETLRLRTETKPDIEDYCAVYRSWAEG